MEGVSLENFVMVGDSRGDYLAFKTIGNNGLIAYVGRDERFAEELKKEFPRCYLTMDKRSSGVVEIINHLLKLH